MRWPAVLSLLSPGSKAREAGHSADDSAREAWRLDQQLLDWATGIGILVPIIFAWPLVRGLGLHPFWIPLALIVWVPLLVGINRWTVREMSGQDSIPPRPPHRRTAATVLMSLLVSLSGTLLFFDNDIRMAVHIQNESAINAALAMRPPSRISQLREQEKVASDRAQAADRNSETLKLKERLASAELALSDAQKAISCEADGTCGSRTAGTGPIYEVKVAIRDDVERQRDALSMQLIEARRQDELTRQDALQDQDAIRSQIADLQVDEREPDDVATAEQIRAEYSNTGIWRRISAFLDLGENRPAVSVFTPLVLLALFVALDLLVLTFACRRLRVAP